VALSGAGTRTADQAVEDGLQLAPQLGDTRTAAFCQLWGGVSAYMQHDFGRSESSMHDAAEAFASAGDTTSIASAQIRQGALAGVRGDLGAAEGLLQQSRIVAEQLEDAWLLARSTLTQGSLLAHWHARGGNDVRSEQRQRYPEHRRLIVLVAHSSHLIPSVATECAGCSATAAASHRIGGSFQRDSVLPEAGGIVADTPFYAAGPNVLRSVDTPYIPCRFARAWMSASMSAWTNAARTFQEPREAPSLGRPHSRNSSLVHWLTMRSIRRNSAAGRTQVHNGLSISATLGAGHS